jgi:hypothetical protein
MLAYRADYRWSGDCAVYSASLMVLEDFQLERDLSALATETGVVTPLGSGIHSCGRIDAHNRCTFLRKIIN